LRAAVGAGPTVDWSAHLSARIGNPMDIIQPIATAITVLTINPMATTRPIPTAISATAI